MSGSLQFAGVAQPRSRTIDETETMIVERTAGQSIFRGAAG